MGTVGRDSSTVSTVTPGRSSTVLFKPTVKDGSVGENDTLPPRGRIEVYTLSKVSTLFDVGARLLVPHSLPLNPSESFRASHYSFLGYEVRHSVVPDTLPSTHAESRNLFRESRMYTRTVTPWEVETSPLVSVPLPRVHVPDL